MTVKIAIIGAGLMGADHAKIIAEDLPGATLQVVCDMDENRARAVADSYGAHDVDTNPHGVIARSDVDAVIVASPDFTHASLSMICITHGKKVLCEKPLSQSPEQCVEVMTAEQASGTQSIQLGFMRRYDQSYIDMKQALANDTLGRALMMHNFHRNVATPASDFTGAMAITNSAPHEFDIVRHVLGTEYVSISAFQPKRSDAVVAPVFMVLETADGQLVNIEINNNASYGYDVRAEVVGEKASIAMNSVSYTRIDRDLGQSIGYEPDWRGRYAEAYRRQNRDFLKFTQTGVFPDTASSSWDGYCAAIVAQAGVKALNEGRKVPVKMMSKPEFYA